MEQAFSAMAGGLSGAFGKMNSGTATSWQGGATALSMLSSITAGRMARNEGNQAASMSFYAADFARKEGEIAHRQAGLDARQEEIAGRARATALSEELLQTIGGQRVAFAASGVDPSSGTAARMQDQTMRKGEQDLKIERSNTEIAKLQALIRGSTARRGANLDAASLEAEGRSSRSRGKSAEYAGYLTAAETGFKYKVDVKNRK